MPPTRTRTVPGAWRPALQPNPAEQSGKIPPTEVGGIPPHTNRKEGAAVSVLKSKRSTSKAEYVNVANLIYTETVAFLTRLSARYARLLAEPVAALAGEVIDHTEKANSIFPKGAPNLELRKGHLLEARAALMALDVRLGHCYTILALNPQGCFTKPDGKSIPPAEATKKLDDMAQSLGEKIDRENELIRAVIESDRKRK